MGTFTRQIVAIGEDGLQVCAGLAQRRQAQVAHVDRAQTLLDAPERYLTADLTYIVGLLNELSPQAIESIHGAAARHPQRRQLSLLVGNTPDQLRRAIDRIASQPSVGRGPVHATGPTGTDLVPQCINIVEIEDLPTVNLGIPSDALFIFAHGNGLEMAAGPSAVLCRRDELSAAEGLRRGLPCFNGAPCAMALRQKRRLSLSAIHAQRLIVGSCFLMTPGTEPFDRNLSLGVGLLDRPLLECIIGTTTVTTIDNTIANLLAFFVLSGFPFAEATRRINKHLLGLGWPARFCCFGDGETRLEKRTTEGRLELDSSRPNVAMLAFEGAAPAVDFQATLPESLRSDDATSFLICTGMTGAAFFEDGGERLLYASVSAESRAASQGIVSIRRLQQRSLLTRMQAVLDRADFVRTLAAIFSGVSPSDKASPTTQGLDRLVERVVSSRLMHGVKRGDVVNATELVATHRWLTDGIVEVQRALVEAYRGYAAEEGVMPPFERWSQMFAYIGPKESDRTCTYNASHGIMATLEYRSIATRARRHVYYCLACGPMHDAPADLLPTVETERDVRRGATLNLVVRLNAETKGQALLGAAHIKHFDAPQTLECALTGAGYPEAADDLLSCAMRVPEAFPAGVFHVGALLLRDLDVAFLRRPLFVK